MKYYLIAGEASGDLHGANLMRAIKKKDPDAIFRFYGGDLMQMQGGSLVCHYRKLAFMGFFEVLANIRVILSNLSHCKKDILSFSPDSVILIDYPGFNLRVAKFARLKGFKVFYYIAPKVWAWKKSRIKLLRDYIHQIFVIFPFEVDFFRAYGVEVEYYGNPLKDAIAAFRERRNPDIGVNQVEGNNNKQVIALLCGSRIHEIQHCLPAMKEAAKAFPAYRFVVAGVGSVDESVYRKILDGTNIEFVVDSTYALLENAYAAIVTSGTATLETALFKVPQVVIYKIGALTYLIGRLFVNVRFFSLVNIVAGKEVVKELLQVNLPERIIRELKKITKDESYRVKMMNEYNDIEKVTGQEGVSDQVGARIVQLTERKV